MTSGLSSSLVSAPLRTRKVFPVALNTPTRGTELPVGPAKGCLNVDANGDIVLVNTSNTNYLKPNIRTATNSSETGFGTGWAALFVVHNGIGVFAAAVSGGTPFILLKSNTRFGWGNIDINGAHDTILTRRTGGNLCQGDADAASPVSQTFSCQSVVAGTSNAAGAARNFDGSQGTGTGLGGDILFRTAPAGSSGSTQNALSAHMTLKGDAARSTVFAGPVTLPAYAVSALPAAASYPYAKAFVTDATANTYGATVTGGGSTKAPVWSDGTNWIIG